MMRAILRLVPEPIYRRPSRPALVAGVTFALTLTSAACVRPGASTPAHGTLSIVASFYPLAYAAERVGGDTVSVTNLTPPGVEPHDLELTPEDVVAIAEADAVVYLGGGFQPSVEAAVEAEASGATLDALAGVEPLPGSDADPHAEVDAATATDPHVWLDPERYADVAARIAAVLAEIDPGVAGTVRRNAATFDDELTALDGAYRRGLADCGTRMLVTSHAAFGYLASAYELRQRAISGLAPESEPDPARLAELARVVREAGVTTIFTEDLVSPEAAEALAAEAGVGTAVLSPLEGLTDDQVAAGEDYLSVMRTNLRTLREGLGCA